MKNSLAFFLVSILLISVSCSDEVVHEDMKDIVDGKWASNDNIKFKFNIEDSARSYHLVYMLRNGIDYNYYNLYLKFHLLDSVGNEIEGNLQELILMDSKTGKPLGKGFGSFYDHQFISVRDFTFPYNGTYYFDVHNYMRPDTLNEIYALGFKVIPSDE